MKSRSHRTLVVTMLLVSLVFVACASQKVPTPPDLRQYLNPDDAENALFVTIDMARTWFKSHPDAAAESNFKSAARGVHSAIGLWRATGHREPYAAAIPAVETAYPKAGGK